MSQPDVLHLDPELLALIALGERPGTPEENAVADRHLASCGYCRSEVDELAAVARTARATEGDGPLVPPPDRVWDAITAELAADGTAAPVVELDSRRRGGARWLPMVAAACAGAVLGGLAVYGVNGSRTPDPTSTVSAPTLLAQAALAPLKGATATGSAEVVSTASGPHVAVDVTGLVSNDGYYEVWLLDRSGTKVVALGALDGASRGEFAMPPGVSMQDYPVVDVSWEPNDGNPAHSHQSLVRGTLRA